MGEVWMCPNPGCECIMEHKAVYTSEDARQKRCPYCASRLYPVDVAKALFKAMQAAAENHLDLHELAEAMLDYELDLYAEEAEPDWLAVIGSILRLVSRVVNTIADQTGY